MFHRTLAFVPVLVVAGSAVAQSACLDQSYVPTQLSNGLEITASQPVTQTFTCGRAGHLLQIELARIEHHNGVTTNPLTVSIVTTDTTGTPTATVLASVVLQPSAVPVGIGSVLVDLAAFNLQVTAGQVLGIALTSPNGPGTPSYGWWGEAPGGGYANGQVFIQNTVSLSVWDLAFQTWVSVPASWNNYGSGHIGSLAVPHLWASANPVLGTTPNLELGSSSGLTSAGAIFFGVQTANAPTPWGGTAHVVPLTSVGLAVPGIGGAIAFPIPANPLLCGFELYAQGIVLDNAASHGLAFTPGLRLVLGD
jgi:hypothetical protein